MLSLHLYSSQNQAHCPVIYELKRHRLLFFIHKCKCTFAQPYSNAQLPLFPNKAFLHVSASLSMLHSYIHRSEIFSPTAYTLYVKKLNSFNERPLYGKDEPESVFYH